MSTKKTVEERLTELERRMDLLDSPVKNPKFEDVAKYIQQFEKVSSALLQREFKIGYSKAAELMDKLEEKGFISPLDGTSKKVLITDYSKYKDVKKAFKIMSDQQLIDMLNNEIDPGWEASRTYYIRSLQEEIDSRGFDYSAIGGKSSMPLRNKIKLEGKKIKKD